MAGTRGYFAAALLLVMAASAAVAGSTGTPSTAEAWHALDGGGDRGWCTLMFTALVLLGVAWLMRAMMTQPIKVEVADAMTQSQVTYTSPRQAATPRFAPLAEYEQGVWRDGSRA